MSKLLVAALALAALVFSGALAMFFARSGGGAGSVPLPPIGEFVERTFGEIREPAAAEARPTPAAEPVAQRAAPVAATLAASCGGANSTNFDCYEAFFQTLTREQGSAAAFAALRAEYPEDSYVKSQCHPLTHVIGREAAARFADPAEAFREADSFCWSGYHHGVMEAIIGRIGRRNLPNQLDDICRGLREARQFSFDHYNCVHGLGHGVMAITQTELFESLELCDNLKDVWERASCWSGAFMENVIVDGLNHVTKYLKPDDPLYPCNVVGEQYKQTCYLMQTSYMLKVVNGDFKKVFDLCERADAGHVETCYQSLGRDASGRSVSDVAQTRATCMLGKDFTQQSNCIIGAVKDFISYLHDDERAQELCASFDQELQNVCSDTAASYYQLL